MLCSQAGATINGLGRWIDGVDPWPPIASPMDVHEQYAGPRSTWGFGVLAFVVCEVVAEDGTYGCGVTWGGEPACFIIERHLSRFVEGRDPRDIESMCALLSQRLPPLLPATVPLNHHCCRVGRWDQMWRASMPYGRKGIAVHALSAVDLALYDLLGKLREE